MRDSAKFFYFAWEMGENGRDTIPNNEQTEVKNDDEATQMCESVNV